MSEERPWQVLMVKRDDEGRLTDRAYREEKLGQAGVPKVRNYATEAEAEAAARANLEALRGVGETWGWTAHYAKAHTQEGQDEGEVHLPRCLHIETPQGAQ